VTGGPYFFSEFVQRWHLFPMKAAIILQYSQAEGLPYCLTLNSHFLQIVLVFPLLPTSYSMHTYISNFATTEETFFILPFLLEL